MGKRIAPRGGELKILYLAPNEAKAPKQEALALRSWSPKAFYEARATQNMLRERASETGIQMFPLRQECAGHSA